MSNPIIFNRGVKYIKLAKFDTGSTSENLTTQLGEVNTIRVNYSDKGIVEYPISSIIEHETYYLYRIATTDATSSSDNTKLNYYFTASAVNDAYFPPESNATQNVTSYNPPLSDTLLYFNASSGKYTYGDTPNTPITASISCSLLLESGTADNPYGFSLLLQKIDNIGNTSTIANAGSNTGDGTDNYSASLDFSFTPIEGEQYFIGVNSAYQGSGDPEYNINVSFLLITSSTYTTVTGTQIPVISEPFFSEPFYNGDYDVLVNNTPNARRSNLFFDVDYSDNIIQAVNQQVLISSSQQGRLGAPYARIQDYNYYIDRSLLPRYKGSRITKDAVNSTSTTASSYIQLSQPGQNLGVDTSGQPIVESLNSAIYSVKFGGGTTPEISGLGGTSLSDILLIGSNRDDITVIPQGDKNYSTTLNSSIEPGDNISFYQYGASSKADIPQKLEVVSTNVRVPTRSSYMIPDTTEFNVPTANARFTNDLGGKAGLLFVSASTGQSGPYRVALDNDGFYTTGSRLPSSSFMDEFETEFDNNPNNWYLSTYEVLGSTVTDKGSKASEPYRFTSGFTTSDPLGFYGVSKIIDVVNTGNNRGLVLDRPSSTFPLNRKVVGRNTDNPAGILIWESVGESIIVRGDTLSGLNASLAYSEFSPPQLTNNLDYISRTYTNKS